MDDQTAKEGAAVKKIYHYHDSSPGDLRELSPDAMQMNSSPYSKNSPVQSTISSYDYLVKILTLGDSGVGKTSLICHYVDHSFASEFVSTIGIDFKEKRLIYRDTEVEGKNKNYRIHLQLWDTAGQERFRSLAIAFFRDAMGYLVVFDVTNEQSFYNIRKWIDQLKTHSYVDEPDIILCGNKCDLDKERKITVKDAQNFASNYNMPYYETSARSGQNVDVVFDKLVELILQRMEKSISESIKKNRPSQFKKSLMGRTKDGIFKLTRKSYESSPIIDNGFDQNERSQNTNYPNFKNENLKGKRQFQQKTKCRCA